jgi:branched-chain amino acid transport system permease protein
MRFFLKQSYDHDINIARDKWDWYPYIILAAFALVAPFIIGKFWLSELSALFIFSIAGLGLMLLTGYTGLASIGHAAFLGFGAYIHVYLLKKGVPLPLSLLLSMIGTGCIGAMLGVPTLRLTGIYLAIATIAFGQISEQIFSHFVSFTGGFRGSSVPKATLFGVNLSSDVNFYFLTLGILTLVIFGIINLLRSPTGRAFVAVRDSEIAAQAMGVNLARIRGLSFALSAAVTGLAGALFAHKTGYISPEAFTLTTSIQLLLLVVIGGLGSIHGAVFGALVIVSLPQVIAIMKTSLPQKISNLPGLEPGIFGLILVLVVIYEPLGIYGRWRKIKLWFSYFPLTPRASFKRVKAFAKSERNK